MPKEQIVIEQFRGVVQSADSRDVDLQVASHMMDMDPVQKFGELRGRFTDTTQNATALNTDVIALFRDGNEGVVWDGTDLTHTTTVDTDPTDSGVSSTPTSSGTASMASSGQAIRVGLGNGSTHVPQWVGEIDHDQFNGAVGPPSGTTHIRDAPVLFNTNSSVGTVTETNATSAAEAVWPINTWVRWNVSYEYDGFQHSPMGSLKTDRISSANGASQLSFTLVTSPTSFPERITAILLWRATASGELSSHPLDGPFVLAERIGMDNTGWSFNSPNYEYSVVDQGAAGPTWEAYTGLPENQTFTTDLPSARLPADHNKIYYQHNTIANGYHFVAKVYHPNLDQTDNWMFRSLRNRHDMYNWSEDFLILPTEPIHIEEFLGRVYAFSTGIVYRINPETFDIEDTIVGVGISGPESVLKTERGMLFCDTKNIYFHDGREIQTIGFPILNNDYSSSLSWLGASHGTNPVVTYDGSIDSFIIIFESTSGNYHSFIYYHPRKEWYIWSHIGAGGGAPTVGYVTHTGKPIAVFAGTHILLRGDTVNRKSWKWVSKEVNQGIESLVPYYAWLEGNASTLLVREEHSTPYQINLGNNANYDGYRHQVEINSQVRGESGATSWGRWNKVRLEINGSGSHEVNALGMKVRFVDNREGAYDASKGGGTTDVEDLEVAPTTIWWIDDSAPESVYKATIDIGSEPWAQSLVGSFDASSLAAHIRVDENQGFIFTLEIISGTYYIKRRTTAWASETDVVNSSEAVWSFCIHRGSQTVYYIVDNGTVGYLIKQCEYDGSNKQTIGTVTAGGTLKGKTMAVNQGNTHLYWHHAFVVESTDLIKKLEIATATITDIITNPPVTVSGEVNTALIDDDEDKMFVSGRVPSTSEGIYEIANISTATPGSYSLIAASPTASETGLAFDRTNQHLYYVDDTVLDDIMRMGYDGTGEVEVVTSTTGNDVKGICSGVD